MDGAEVQGLELASGHLLHVANGRAPLEEGNLVATGAATVDAPSKTAAVSYDTVYAARQHEELTWRHAPGRTAKYLEGPMHEEREVLLQLAAVPGRRLLGG